MAGLSADVDVVVEGGTTQPVDPDELRKLAGYALAAAGAEGAWAVTLVLTDDSHLRRLHRDFMGIDEVTDVMTFPYGDMPGGDVVISTERAAEQAPEFGHGPREEVAFLAIHGVLHLCDWDDGTPERRADMLARQAEIIASFRAGRDPRTC